MKILNASQLHEADAYTIANEPVKSLELMERAAQACTDQIIPAFDKKHAFFVFCGTGNNGGDGLAIARQLYDKGFDIHVFILDFSSKATEDFLVNKERLQRCGTDILALSKEKHLPALPRNAVIIDAIFGTGLTRPAEGQFAEIIHDINKAGKRGVPVISVDLPSGLFVENNALNNPGNIVHATYTFTFQFPKLAFMFPENAVFIGEWKVLDIGISDKFIKRITTSYFFTDFETASSMRKRRGKFSHKGTFGHAFLIAGTYGKMGAAVLASRACIRSGAGLLTTHVPKSGLQIMQTAVPESMLSVDSDEKVISESVNIEKYTAIGVGPGIGTEKSTQTVVKMIIQNTGSPVLIDADGLNILAENKTWISFLPPGTILTPHPKEFERLAGKTSDSFERLSLLQEFAAKYNIIVVLKGAHTAIALPDKSVYFNSTGNPGMATGGTGDVLSGIITGLLAQGYGSFEAAVFGVYLHGLAGDLALENMGEEAIIASDIIHYLPKAFFKIGRN